MFELNFYQGENKWKHKLSPIEVCKNNSDRVIELLIYKNHNALIEKLNVISGDDHQNFVCRRCLNSYTCENALINRKEKCGEENIFTIKTSNDSHLYWKKHFFENQLCFWIIAVFEADNEIDNSNIGNKSNSIYKQIPVLIGYYLLSDLEDVLKSGYYESPLSYNNVDWFVREVIKIKNKKAFYFKNTKKDIIMTEEDEEDCKIIKFVDFVKKY